MLWFLLPLHMLSNTYEAVSTPLLSISQQCIREYTSTAELHLSRCWLSGLPIIWIGLALGLSLSRILQN
jgi:hypothetical protein